jgi:hypothetical protein
MRAGSQLRVGHVRDHDADADADTSPPLPGFVSARLRLEHRHLGCYLRDDDDKAAQAAEVDFHHVTLPWSFHFSKATQKTAPSPTAKPNQQKRFLRGMDMLPKHQAHPSQVAPGCCVGEMDALPVQI